MRAQLEQAVDASVFALWLDSVHPHALHDGTLVLAAAPDRVGWVRERFGAVLTACACAELGQAAAIDFVPCQHVVRPSTEAR